MSFLSFMRYERRIGGWADFLTFCYTHSALK
jgi:hypothetical protein